MANKAFVFRFADVEVREREFSLIKAGEVLPVEPKAFRVLLILLRNPQKLITKEELLNAVWGDAAVTENSLTRSIALLRRLLGDDTRNPRFIETVATVGYRFVCKVEISEDSAGNLEATDRANDLIESNFVKTSANGENEAATANPSGQSDKVNADKEKFAKQTFGRGDRFWRWLLPSTLVLAGSLATTVWYLRRPLPPPHISSEFKQITHDGRLKKLAGTDGSRLYFSQISPEAIAQVGVTGGDIGLIPFAMAGDRGNLLDVSPDGNNFIVSSRQPEDPAWVIWNVPILGGVNRRLGYARSATFSPGGDLVAYSTPEHEIWVIRSDGTGAHRLASTGGEANFLSWSPDGNTIRFSIENFLWEISSSGSNLHKLLPTWHPSSRKRGGRWTPDGKFFAFVSGDQIWAIDERRGLFRQPPAEPIRLTSGPIRWGQLIAGKNGSVIFSDGKTPRGELSHYDSQSKQFSPFLGGASAESVSFSKDGRFVAYVSFPGGILWKANRDGSSPVQLTEPPIYPLNPRWSPDGTQIVYTDISTQPDSVIYIVPSTSGGSRRLLPESTDPTRQLLPESTDPNWSADGQKIVYAAEEPGDARRRELRMLDLAGGQITTVPGSAGAWSPRWSPDGRYIAALPTGPGGLLVFDFETQRWSNVPTKGGENFPVFSRDSKSIYFVRFGRNQGVFRIRVAGGEEERVVELKDMHLTGTYGGWFGLDPADAPLLLRDIGSDDIYALTLEQK
jgi:DNA-binding winged helix-turn-helix (wHTH) protein/Tol biopolymer transport system component